MATPFRKKIEIIFSSKSKIQLDLPRLGPTHWNWKLCLRQKEMDGYINDSWKSYEPKFGVEMISFINHQSHPAHQINLTPFEGKSL